MPEIEQTSDMGRQVVGKVFIIYGTVKAISPKGKEWVLSEDYSGISIQLDGILPIQLHLGRMADIIIDEDVYAGVTPELVIEASADPKQIQEVLFAGDRSIAPGATAGRCVMRKDSELYAA
jgi:hypothetical protein